MSPPADPAAPSLARSIRDAMWSLTPSGRPRPVVEARDVAAELIAALGHGRPIAGFDMGSAVVIAGRMAEPRVWVRADGRTWTLTTIEAATVALRIRIAAFRAADLLADAFNRAIVEAEGRMDRLHSPFPEGLAPRIEDGE
ncbi:hypothetical protein KOAAANKH_00124 [Brevundimonas sp. NIBR10]|uniref:hypothetical protein n=1 Tax=Brevundimonas sp. NIBR10 TaxID=3015997 RepID=UPI0022F1586E|nr:hypothetical protein [Brevundimonas sp. NIBR10]WGM45263.1 hypothetical protein KOAAANKH_00124 [Brevundimonas sp. NIBR10]